MSSPSSQKTFRIGMFGGGVVGGGVYEILMQRRLPFVEVEIVKICVRDTSKPRSFAIDESKTIVTSNPDDILNDHSLDCIVEVMGGVGLAANVVKAALRNHTHVVTANKALLAERLEELQHATVASQASLCYEAAVCGGIPIIHVLSSCYAGDVIHSVSGICNGTTNYMLCKMADGYDYSKALKEAQDLGYAEADPTADVEGLDVRAKICLLAKLAFGTRVSLSSIPCTGISGVTSADFENAKSLDATIKLVGSARCHQETKSISVYVTPIMVPNDHALAGIRGSGNAVLVDSQNMGTCSYTGPGAGRFPTANSVVADVYRLAKQHAASGSDAAKRTAASSKPFPWETHHSIEFDYSSPSWYVRLPESIADHGEVAARHGVDIAQRRDGFWLTKTANLSQVQSLCEEIGATLYMPFTE